MRDKGCVLYWHEAKVPDMAICCLFFWVTGDNGPLLAHSGPRVLQCESGLAFCPQGQCRVPKHHDWWALIWPPRQTQAFLCNLQAMKRNLPRRQGVERTMMSTSRWGRGFHTQGTQGTELLHAVSHCYLKKVHFNVFHVREEGTNLCLMNKLLFENLNL